MKDEKKQPVTPPPATPKEAAKATPKLPSLPTFHAPVWVKYMFLPLMFLKFWFYESPMALLKFFWSLNGAFFHLFSLPVFLKTYFKPLKNEYRPGLVGFSRAIGMIIKTWFIIADVLMFALLLLLEVTIFVTYIFLPIATVWLLFL
jgi:hypothetical protein